MMVTIEERLRPTRGMRGYAGPELVDTVPIVVVVVVGSWH